MRRNADAWRGCLVGGAIGDSLGWPVEFLSMEAIRNQYGSEGIRDLVLSSSGQALITDDTQMTLFTAEGILRAQAREVRNGSGSVAESVFQAYRRWLSTQDVRPDWLGKTEADGWLYSLQELHTQRAPGSTCLAALRSGVMGTVEDPINDSKGCGGVMRMAPVGLFYPADRAFKMGAQLAAITHGHPSGFLSAGAFAHLLAELVSGKSLGESVGGAIAELRNHPGHEECTDRLALGLTLAEEPEMAVDAIPQIGEGWVGEEALAISVYCALKHSNDFAEGVIAAVNHSGDSDSTGAITGNILGAWLGYNRIPQEWVQPIELKEVLLQMAADLITGYEDTPRWHLRYPQA